MAFENLVDLFESSVEKYGSSELFGTVHDGSWNWVSFSDVGKMVDHARGGLAGLGVGPGDNVAVISNNRIEWAVGCYATYGRRAGYIPMYEAQKKKDWKYILADSGAKVCLCATKPIYDQVVELVAEIDTLEHAICFEGDGEGSWKALLENGAASPVDSEQPESTETAGFIYTSGTTGNPKGVILSHGNLTSNINALQKIFPLQGNDRSLSFLPWAHSFGQTVELHGMLSMGASIAINDEIPNLVGNLAVVKPTVLYAVPRIFNRIYDGVNKQMSERGAMIQGLFADGVAAATKKNAGESLGFFENLKLQLADKLIFSKIRERFGGRLKYAVSGSAALNADVAKFIDSLGIEVYEGYGLTETSPIATANFPGHRKIGSVGLPIEHVKIVIDKEVTGDPVNGEIVIYGPNVMQGYHNRDEETKKAIMEDGGFRTGDMGRLDDDGYLYITGRIKEQYKLENGKYVVPSPLEEELKLSPFIGQVMIYGMNKPYNVAVVVPDLPALEKWCAENGAKMDAQDDKVRKLIEDQLAEFGKGFKGYERPKKFIVTLDEFSTDNDMLTPTLKLKRRNVLAVYQDAIDALYT